MIQLAANQDRTKENSGFNDLYIENNDIAIVKDVNAIQQSVKSGLWFCLKDYAFNKNLGIPWNVLLNMQPLDLTLIHYHVKTAILNINNFIPENELVKFRINDDINISFNKNNVNNVLQIIVNYNLANGINLTVTTDDLNLE